MPSKPAIYDATVENFPTLVTENLRNGPVVVNFGSPTAAPCRLTLERLSNLMAEFGGRFLLVHVDTDAQIELARQCDVQSIPSTHLFINGERVEVVRGAESEASFRLVLDKYLSKTAAADRVKAHTAYQVGEVEKALTLLAQAAMEDPHDIEIPLDLAKGRYRITDQSHIRQSRGTGSTLSTGSIAIIIRQLRSRIGRVVPIAPTESRLQGCPSQTRHADYF